MQTHLLSKIMHKNLAVILQQLNYVKKKLKQNGSEYPPSQNWSEHQMNEKDEPHEAPEKRFRR